MVALAAAALALGAVTRPALTAPPTPKIEATWSARPSSEELTTRPAPAGSSAGPAVDPARGDEGLGTAPVRVDADPTETQPQGTDTGAPMPR